jgi:hypothetical protein
MFSMRSFACGAAGAARMIPPPEFHGVITMRVRWWRLASFIVPHGSRGFLRRSGEALAISRQCAPPRAGGGDSSLQEHLRTLKFHRSRGDTIVFDDSMGTVASCPPPFQRSQPTASPFLPAKRASRWRSWIVISSKIAIQLKKD